MDFEKFQVEPFGVHVAHTWLEVGIVLDAINCLCIKKFVEIGIYKGGLAALLVHTTKHVPGFEYLGVEIDSQIVEPTVRKLCDGGDKPKEFAKYAPMLRFNDFIAAHDWDYGGYHRAEIRPRDVEKPVADNNLTKIGFTEPIRIGLWKKV